MALLPLDDVRLYYDEQGAGPPVLMIHGAGGYADLYTPLATELATTHHVVSYDRRGFGRSVHRPVRDLRQHVPDAARLIEERLGGRATVVGWSAGGVVALHLAVEFPQLVAGLVLAEPALLMKAPRLSLLWEVAKWQLVRRRHGAVSGAEYFYRWVSRYRTGGNAFDDYPTEWQAAMTGHADALFAEVRAGSGATGERLARRDLLAVGCPLKTFVGELTVSVFPPAAYYLQNLLPDSQLTVVPQSSHMIPTDAPQVIAQAVRDIS